MELKTARFKHACNSGDLLASMASIKKYYELTNKKVIICQQLNVPAQYPIGSKHPVTDDSGAYVCMNRAMLNMITPLLMSQEYIGGVEEYVGQGVDIDIDVIRQKCFVNMPFGAIQSWVMLAYPDLACDLSKPWILGVEKYEIFFRNKIIINFTDRYRNNIATYFFLKEYQDNILFAGTKKERDTFCEQWKLEIGLLEVEDFFHLAEVIKSARFFMGNQSMCWNLAEAMKTPRILELSLNAPNCIPFIGEDSYGFFHQVAVEFYFKHLFNKTKN